MKQRNRFEGETWKKRPYGRSKRTGEDIKMNVTETVWGSVDLNNVAQDRDSNEPACSIKCREFLDWSRTNFSRRTPLHGVGQFDQNTQVRVLGICSPPHCVTGARSHKKKPPINKCFCKNIEERAVIAQSVKRLDTGWTVRGSNHGGGEIFRTRPFRPWDPPSILRNGYRVSYPGITRPGHGIDHPLPSSAAVKERVELYLYSPSGPSWPVLGWTLNNIAKVKSSVKWREVIKTPL